MVKSSITCGYEKIIDLLRLLMLVVVDAIFDTKDRLSRCVLRRRLSPL